MTGHRSVAGAMMAIMDIVVVPSLGEPFGFVNLEAMALGKPVVAFASGGIPEVISDGETGLLADPGNTKKHGRHDRPPGQQPGYA